MTLTYQRVTAVLLLIYGSLFLSGIYVCFDDVDISSFHRCVVVDLGQYLQSGIYYCLRVFWCPAARMSELE